MKIELQSISKDRRRVMLTVGKKGESTTVHAVLVSGESAVYEDRHGIRYRIEGAAS